MNEIYAIITAGMAMGDSITRDKVMVACVVGEVTLITEPAIRSNVDRIHLIHYIKAGTEKDERARFYQSFYDATAEELQKAGIEIVEHSDAETYVFRSMMSKVYEILVEEAVQRKSLVYVNLSGGTNEYAAAAAICSMMYKDVEVFTVGKGYDGRTRDYDQLRENAMKDGKLVGSCSTIGGTYMVDKYPIDRPDDNLLKAFKIYAVISQSEHRNSNTTVIRNLILQNVWMAKGPLEERAAIKGTSVELELPDRGYACPQEKIAAYIGRQRGEAVQYYRVYISQWESRGWIAKIPGTKKYAITNEGLTVLEVFCPEKFISFGTGDIVIQGAKYCRKTWWLPLSCFNVLAKNYDDHPGNFSFLYLPEEGRYVLSPGYDLTRTPGMREHHMTCIGNPLPGEKELFALASEMNIPRGQAEEIVTHVKDVVSEDLSEWL